MSPTSSESPYVSMDLLLYLESGQTMPFHIFADVVMPDFLNHLSQFLPASENESCCSNLFKEIRNDLNFIKKACGRVKQWEDHVNKEMEGLIIQSSDDAFKEEKEAQKNPLTTNFLQEKLEKAHSVVSMLKNQIFSPPELDSESFKRSSFSMRDQSQLPPVQLPDQNIINRTIAEIQVVYDRLDEKSKKCLLCFSVFPENAVIKKKVLVHWWIGEGFIDSPSSGGKTAEETGNEFFQIFISERIIELVSKKLRPSTENYKMQPSIRDAVIMLAKTDGFFCFDEKGNLTANLCGNGRACLVKTVKGSSLRQLTYSFDSKPENIETLFNVNEPHLDFRVDFFSEMKKVRVLQLGSWQASDQQLVEVEDGGFLKGLKKMKDLRYFSLRGISGITELPDAICRLRKLRILNLNGCHNLEKLPEGIGSLSMLTYLDMCKCYFISHMPKGLALLSQLQVLKGFVIRKSRPRVEYCKLADLVKLENLRKLIIHVDRKYDKAEEELLSLPQFKSLRSLSVAWSRIYCSSTPTNQTTIQRIVSTKSITDKITSSRTRSTPPRTPVSKSPGPASLEKLGLLYFTGSKMPDWLKHFDLQKLKKLYLREGESLLDLHSKVYHLQTVTALRLKYLPQLRMNWTELHALFPNLSYLENVECPKLSLFECDENGEWMRVNASVADKVGGNADNDTVATIADNVSDDQKKADESDLCPSLLAHSNSSLTELSMEVQVLQNHDN